MVFLALSHACIFRVMEVNLNISLGETSVNFLEGDLVVIWWSGIDEFESVIPMNPSVGGNDANEQRCDMTASPDRSLITCFQSRDQRILCQTLTVIAEQIKGSHIVISIGDVTR